MKISEVIVVEGKNDVARVSRAVDAYVVSVSGQGINKETIAFLKELNKKRGLIVLMDPDTPGEKIRAIITEQIPDVKHAFIKKELALKDDDVGIENASVKAIQASLAGLISPTDKVGAITLDDLIRHKLVFSKKSSTLRKTLTDYLNIGKCNGKTLLKRLNMLNMEKDKFEKIMEKLDGS